jgi:hypothetical protein
MTKPIVQESALVQHRAQGLSLINPLKIRVEAIEIKDADDYALADETLTAIMLAQKAWEGRLDPIISPIRSGLDLLYDLKRDILKPLQSLEKIVKGRMVEWKSIEKAKVQQALQEKEEAERVLQKELADKEIAEAKARTKPMLDRILEQKSRLQQALVDKQNEIIEPIKVAGSSARSRKVWKTKDKLAFVKYLVKDRPDLLSLIQIDSVQMNALFKLQRDELELGEWMPGIEIEEDINIAGKSR